MAPSTRQRGVRRISGLPMASAENERVDSIGSSIGFTHDSISPSTERPTSEPSPFSIHYTNIRGLRSNFSSVEHHLATALPNILLLSETQLSSTVSPAPFQISHYNFLHRFRSNGGVCAYYNINTPIARLMDLESSDFDVMWLKICLPTSTTFLCFSYCSLALTDYAVFFDYLTSCHESVLSSHPSAEVVYLGDFNVHHTEWLGSSCTDVGGEQAHSFSVLNDLEQIIQHPTRVPDRHDQTPNPLDLFFTSCPLNYQYSISAPLGSSDHTLISVSSSLAPPPPIPSTKRQLWHFEDAQWTDMREFFRDFPWDDYCFSSRNPNQITNRIAEVINSGMEAYIPSSIKSFSPTKPWFDRTCSNATQARDRAFRTWKNSPSPITHSSFISARNRCKLALRRAKHRFVQKKCDDLTSSPSNSSFWSLAKNVSNNFCNSNFPPLFKPDGSIAVSPHDKATLFGALFSANSTLDDSDAPCPSDLPLTQPMPLPIFSCRKVRRVLLTLKTRKAYGPDGIPPRVLKECAYELAPVLSRLFRLCLKTGIYPSSWKHVLVQPVPKKGDRSNPSNYRPIALTSTISKVFETLLNAHFLRHLESHSLLSDHQYGFRKARSTGDILSYLTHVWSSSLRDYGETFAIALDISKAFDRVWHKALLAKLPSFGFSPSLCKLILSFLSNRSISVRVDGASSEPFPISSGVPQGSVLSPTLFLLFINDLLQSTKNPIHSYADDSTLHSSSSFNSPPSAQYRSTSRSDHFVSLNSDLDRISGWGRQNLVKFNSSKTQFLPISLSTTPSDYNITFENSSLDPLESINILGINVTSNLSWKSHIASIAKSASKKLGILFRCRHYFSSEQLLQLYKGLIRPCMEYCSHVWGNSPCTRLLDRVESKAIRLINSPHLTSNLEPLSLRRQVASLSLFYRYYFGRCSRELAGCVPPPLPRPRNTRQASSCHQYSVKITNPRIARHDICFFPSTSKLWNSLPADTFPSQYNLLSFKRSVFQFLNS